MVDEKKVVVFLITKIPMIGRSKTRLAKEVGAELALDTAMALLRDITRKTVEETEAELVMYYGPSSATATLMEMALPSAWRAVPIPDPLFSCGDLGAILASGLDLARGQDVAIFIGMDCPYLTRDDFQAAREAAAAGDAYLSPAEDGGYVLLALPASSPPAVFEGVQWSCPRTLESQVAALARVGLRAVLGRTLADIDTADDLRELARRIRGRQRGGEGGSMPLALPALEAMVGRMEASLPLSPSPP